MQALSDPADRQFRVAHRLRGHQARLGLRKRRGFRYSRVMQQAIVGLLLSAALLALAGLLLRPAR
jgi:hypothetical protein